MGANGLTPRRARSSQPALAGRSRQRLRRAGATLALLAIILLSAHPLPAIRALQAARAWLDRQPALGSFLNVLGGGVLSTRRFEVPPPPPRRGADQVARATPPPPGVRVWRVGPGQPFSRIDVVARRARAGDVVEIAAGDYHGDVAVWHQAALVIRGVGGAARLHAEGRSAEGKAIWVLRNGDFDIANIDFIGARVADGNGAGIRFENGRLRLRHCLFWDNQMGLLTGGGPTARTAQLIVENSEFGYSHVDGRWGHNLYVGAIARLQVTGSYFHHAGGGHLLKSRARRNDIRYNRLTDETGGQASYEIEFPEGGQVRMMGNVLQQAASTSNSTLISFGAEGYRAGRNQLVLASNTLVNDHPHVGVFVDVAAGADRVVSANNLLVGHGGYRVTGDLHAWHDVHVARAALADPATFDYRLRQPSTRTFYRSPPETAVNDRLVPAAQYRHPLRSEVLHAAPRVVGALQPSP